MHRLGSRESQTGGTGTALNHSNAKVPISTNAEVRAGNWQTSHENVDAVDSKRFIELMDSHTLSETPHVSSRSANEELGKPRSGSLQNRHELEHEPTATSYTKIDRRTLAANPEKGRGAKFEATNLSERGNDGDVDESDSDADSFDLDMEEKLFTFRQGQAVQAIENHDFAEAETLIKHILTDPIAIRCPQYEDYDNDDWRIFLALVQLAQNKLALGLQTMKTVNIMTASPGQMGFLYNTITILYCRPDNLNLEIAEKYNLKSIKAYRKAKYSVDMNLATELMSHILRKKGDIVASKFYESLLPKGYEARFAGFHEVEVMSLTPEGSLIKADSISVTATFVEVTVEPVAVEPALGKDKLLYAEKLAMYGIVYDDASGEMISGRVTDIEKMFKKAVAEDDVPLVRYLLEERKLFTSIQWGTVENKQTTILTSYPCMCLIGYVAAVHQSMDIPQIILNGGGYPSLYLKAAMGTSQEWKAVYKLN